MNSTRLDSIAPDLVALLQGKSAAELLRVLTDVVTWSFQVVKVDDARLEAGRAALVAHEFGDSVARTQVWSLVEELDNLAWDIQDDEDSRDEAYLEAFARARAVNSVWYALAGPELQATMECAYEAQAAHGDLAGLREIVRAAI